MYNLHCHSLLSDGNLLPSEVAVRYLAQGFKTIAITDHADYSNIKFIIKSILEFTGHWPASSGIRVLPGIELTHIPPSQFKPLAAYSRRQGIKIIVGHGETPVEPVIKGTNQAALRADIDILAHPGFIRDEDIQLAKKRGIFLEITTRKGHSQTNSYVVERALKLGAKMVLNTDSHRPEDIIPPEMIITHAREAGLNREHINNIYKEIELFLMKKGGL
ncbi:MAG: histidinol phosphate phosphatase domain-containing protein [Candidatus Omnitrophota bacterium]|jgi:histidinol phosphatase-like PHP family hydrolase